MASKKVQVLKGFRDYLPPEMIARQRMIEIVTGVFRRYGFLPVDTPALEYAEALVGNYGADSEKLLYRFTDNGGRDVCLRYDLTAPLARFMGEHRQLEKPFKRYQVAPVWRAEKPGRGRFREFVQCDVDIVGTSSFVADAECIALDDAVMTALGVERFSIRVNNRRILAGLAHLANVAPGSEPMFFRMLDKLESQGPDVVKRLLVSEMGLDEQAVARVFEILQVDGADDEILDALAERFHASDLGRQGCAELREVLARARALDVPAERVSVDVSIARGLDYYTGTVFETTLLDLPGFGSVMSGGRYDELIGSFTGEPTPSVGISVGLDRLFAGLRELGLIDLGAAETSVYVIPMMPEALDAALGVAASLRRAGLSAEVAYDAAAKLKKHFKWANTKAIPVVALLGSNELEAGQVTLKRMSDGSQRAVVVGEAVEAVREMLGA